MVIRTPADTSGSRVSKREGRFLDDLLIAGAALGVTAATFIVVAMIGL